MPRLVHWDPPNVPFMVEHQPVDRSYLSRAVKSGSIVRLVRGVYLSAAALPGSLHELHLLQALAIQMRHRTQLIASHETAALALGLPMAHRRPIPPRPRFLIDPRDGVRTGSSGLTRAAVVPPDQRVRVGDGVLEGLVVTCPARTALDLAGELPLHFSLMLLDQVARREALRYRTAWDLRGDVDAHLLSSSVEPLRRVHAMLGARGQAKREIALTLTDPRHESPAESASVARIVAAGLPRPIPQARLMTRAGDFFPDFYWPRARLAGECDGVVKYYGGASPKEQAQADRRRVQEKRREVHLERGGDRVTRWLAEEALHRPQAWLTDLARQLRARDQSW